MDYESFEYDGEIFLVLKKDELKHFVDDIFKDFNTKEVDIPLPPDEIIPYSEFLNIFNEIFEPDENGETLISGYEILVYLDEMRRLHHNKWLDVFVKNGYGDYGVDTNGEITFIPNCKKIKIEKDKNGNSYLKPNKKGKK